jgi:hypothetical protein
MFPNIHPIIAPQATKRLPKTKTARSIGKSLYFNLHEKIKNHCAHHSDAFNNFCFAQVSIFRWLYSELETIP